MKIEIKGIVQGVGFRPFIYNLAKKLNIKGYVVNTSNGILIEAEGENIDLFIEEIKDFPPPLSKIEKIELKKTIPKGYNDFAIKESLDEGSFTLLSPDISICDDCLKELFDPADRRYLYPFINCTNCGPRYSITKNVPYDRPNTTMASFNMCERCSKEYHDPNNRRFHAQPNACHDCGPKIELVIQNQDIKFAGLFDPLKATIELLKKGAIVAIKGIGGFHLCCDAKNNEAVRRLREKKRKNNKPFALMSYNVEAIKRACFVSDEEDLLLRDRRRPIVLLKKKNNKEATDRELSEAIAPNNKYIAFMLPYAPLHYLLFHYPIGSNLSSYPHFDALVMTSGNISEEPIVTENIEALTHLSDIADAFLLHNRDIFMRVDDSVIKVMSHESGVISQKSVIMSQKSVSTLFIRRARGYVPEPILLYDEGPDVLAVGADIKNTFTITKGRYAIVSQHIGDMENLETIRFFEETLSNICTTYKAKPLAIAHDGHPDYFSTRWAINKSRVMSQDTKDRVSLYAIQHHHAHIASVMAEHGIKEKIIGVAFDGSGYGDDGNIWGSEFMICDLKGYQRIAHFEYIALPGAEQAIKECWRTAVSYIVKAVDSQQAVVKSVWDWLEDIGFLKRYGKDNIMNIIRLIYNKEFSPLSSGAGRLFDAVSSIIGLCDRNTFEAEAAMALEGSIKEVDSDESYPYRIRLSNLMTIDFSATILFIINDLINKKDISIISLRFHNTIVDVIHKMVCVISQKTLLKKVALSGGLFQNSFILEKTIKRLKDSGFYVYTNQTVPPNDGGISLGQAYIARHLLNTSSIYR
jgi:hydrogenase maturation protein HypF